MNTKRRIACFFTAGYTELNAMKDFMKKINNTVEYIQLCPTRARRNKEQIRNRHSNQIDQNGITGEALINYIIDFVGKSCFQEEEYDAILIEDDKDNRFLTLQSDGGAVHDKTAWIEFKSKVRKRLGERCPDLPVIFFFAAPEVEAWFLADFEHGFGSIYRSRLSTQQNKLFQVQFRKYINEKILTDKYRDCIEQYGFFDGVYRKLSEQLQNALNETDFLDTYSGKPEYQSIRYSKKIQGEAMLRSIEPEIIEPKCNYYFKEGFWALQSLGDTL